MLEQLVERFRQHDRLALSRLVSLVARGEHLDTIRAAFKLPSISQAMVGPAELAPVRDTLQHASAWPATTRVVAITGNSGVGKSSLIGKLIELLRRKGRTVAVLACDPQSSLTGGALLGDRIRMPNRSDDPGVFIRSLAVASGQQAIATNLHLMVQLLALFGFDVVLLETVGAGQGDTAVRSVADVVTLLLQPETGDELQWEKAGLLEVADVVVIHKSDLPGAERVESQVRELLNLPGCRQVPVLRASANSRTGLDELWQIIDSIQPGYPRRTNLQS
jgi:LAO/AO transport system ATPase